MERKGLLFEIIVKGIYFVFSIIAAVFVVKNIISFFSLYQANTVNESELYAIVGNTHIGKIFSDIGGFMAIDGNIIKKALISFVNNIEGVAIVFLIMTLFLTLIYFVFIKWNLISSYLKLSFVSIGLYLLKYVFFGLCILMFFKDSYPSLVIALNIGTSLYLIVCVAQLFIFSLWIIKFIFNILADLKSYIKY
ncbi:MAG: hypothetical protein IJZ77_05720 [Bacilli bacterium]|nr:hypothetical protein [Bacilli bacterium]